jgi:hypothetical protein
MLQWIIFTSDIPLSELYKWFLRLSPSHGISVSRLTCPNLFPLRYLPTGEWRRLHNKELHALYFLPHFICVIKSRRMRWVGHVAHMGACRGVYRVLVREREGRRLLVRPRRRWENKVRVLYRILIRVAIILLLFKTW